MGWGAIWVPEAVGRDPLVNAALLLSGTERCVVATGIASIYARDPLAMNAGWQAVSEAFPGRFLLGLGVSHRPMVEGMRGTEYGPPIASMRTYLDRMDASLYLAAPPTDPPERLLAALGPKMLELARDRSRGAHPVSRHSRAHRAGTRDPRPRCPARARAEGHPRDRPGARGRSRAPASPSTSRRSTTTSATFAGSASATTTSATRRATGSWTRSSPGATPTPSRRARAAHHDAGADHVAVQVLSDDPDSLLADYRTLADVIV